MIREMGREKEIIPRIKDENEMTPNTRNDPSNIRPGVDNGSFCCSELLTCANQLRVFCLTEMNHSRSDLLSICLLPFVLFLNRLLARIVPSTAAMSAMLMGLRIFCIITPPCRRCNHNLPRT